MSKVMISLPDAFLSDVDALAKAERRSRSELVREAIRTYMTTTVIHRTTSDRKAMQQAAKRILSTRLRLPKGETVTSLIRRMREERYGPGWKTS
ncbi:MAG: hypothetical protein A3I71_02185 [Omnitrophica WOR_2 bacterium RIFCSPLOWO2_02_FULL_63_16]|nr:MAG: hypothetical protein A2Z92_06165 [Omnitrophica WOR_2 bacterium GWA2_63_20]OGX45288.1 MAG: hypothetical protein A3I71_02185 [Omnitrophica WOR_2 bacterium RIFCSPLOWO2_02_FULL_63_16]OGX46953.1 MAG: hypothetical protein A3G88_01625 [Omnitrophica WOR_2 bacterium RIFCSPLOWO2_12_FULL_63_16]